jgi:cysteinyl-tRNA synthetase
MEWESPWGVGFPGWHIECSAMSEKLLGQPFDIHCGGIDHIPVHHENEIAQSEAAFGKSLANYWMHGEFLLVNGGRMGKSEGNAYTLDDLIAKGFDPLAYRYYCLGTHYRSKMNFTWEGLEGAQNALNNLRAAIRKFSSEGAILPDIESFRSAIGNDLNISSGLDAMWGLVKSGRGDIGPTLLEMDKVLGLGLDQYIGKKIEIPLEIKLLADQRLEVRKNKDWAKSDEIRDQIAEKGWTIEDKKDGYELTPRN